MSKTRIFALLLIGIILGAILTNPSKELMESTVKAKAKEILTKELDYKDSDAITLGMTLFGNKMLDNFVSQNVIIRNYYLFSTININWQGEVTPIGGGAFKQVWLSPKIDEKTEEIIRIIKKL